MTATESDASHDAHSYLQHPAVITMDWIGFIILFGSSFVLVYKLMSFKGPNSQPESYFFGYVLSESSFGFGCSNLSNPCKGIENRR